MTWSLSSAWGELGHLGVQFAAKLGFETVAIARGADKEDLARQLGAQHYIDNQAEDVAALSRHSAGPRWCSARRPSTPP